MFKVKPSWGAKSDILLGSEKERGKPLESEWSKQSECEEMKTDLRLWRRLSSLECSSSPSYQSRSSYRSTADAWKHTVDLCRVNSHVWIQRSKVTKVLPDISAPSSTGWRTLQGRASRSRCPAEELRSFSIFCLFHLFSVGGALWCSIVPKCSVTSLQLFSPPSLPSGASLKPETHQEMSRNVRIFWQLTSNQINLFLTSRTRQKKSAVTSLWKTSCRHHLCIFDGFLHHSFSLFVSAAEHEDNITPGQVTLKLLLHFDFKQNMFQTDNRDKQTWLPPSCLLARQLTLA